MRHLTSHAEKIYLPVFVLKQPHGIFIWCPLDHVLDTMSNQSHILTQSAIFIGIYPHINQLSQTEPTVLFSRLKNAKLLSSSLWGSRSMLFITEETSVICCLNFRWQRSGELNTTVHAQSFQATWMPHYIRVGEFLYKNVWALNGKSTYKETTWGLVHQESFKI